MKKKTRLNNQKDFDDMLGLLDSQILSSKRSKSRRLVLAHKNKSGDNWYIYCLYYLEASDYLIRSLPLNEVSENKYDKKRSRIVPAFYLFKHTLELVVKFLSIVFNGQLELTHNSNELLKKFVFKNVISKLNVMKISEQHKIGEEEVQQLFLTTIDKLNDLAERYIFNINLDETNFVVVDSTNELFKYPVTRNVQFIVDPVSLYDSKVRDIRQLQKDFKTLNGIFNIFENAISLSDLYID